MKQALEPRSLKPALRILLASALGFALTSGSSAGAEDLAGAATNPLANLMQFQFQYQYNASHYNTDDSSMMGVIQPVIPFKLPWASVPTLITRTTIPYLTTPEIDLRPGEPPPLISLPSGGFVETSNLDSQSAWGDIVTFGLFLPKLKAKGHLIGIGPVASLPLSSNDYTGTGNWELGTGNWELGTGKWELGPAAVYMNLNTPSWQWGALAYHLWDVADSQQDRSSVNKSFIQPVLVKHLDKGWYLGTRDLLWSYDWRSEKWNVPLGLRIGKVTKIGKQPVNMFIEPIYQPVDEGVANESFS